MNAKIEAALDAAIDEYRQDMIGVLGARAFRAYLVGDLLAQRHLHRVGRHNHGDLTNAMPSSWVNEPTRSTEYNYPDLPSKAGDFGLKFDHVAKESLAYAQDYKSLLEEKGATVINRKEVAWLDGHCATVRADVGATIEDGIKQGWSMPTVSSHLSEVMDAKRWELDRIARTETMRVQMGGMKDRYASAGVEEVARINGPNPCDACAAESGEHYPIDDVPDDHPNGECDFVPVITVPPETDQLIEDQDLAWLLGDDEVLTAVIKGTEETVPGIAALVEQAFTPAKNLQEAAAYTQDVLGIKAVDTKGLALGSVNIYNEQMTYLQTRFPKVVENIQRFGSCQSAKMASYTARLAKVTEYYKGMGLSDDQALKLAKQQVKKSITNPRTVAFSYDHRARPLGVQGIHLNIKYYSKAALEDTKLLIKNDEVTGWHPVGTGKYPESVVTHEFGHQIHSYLEEHGMAAWINEQFASARSQGLIKGQGTAAGVLSEYGAENSHEFAAEAFAEYIHNPNPRPVAKLFGETMEKAIEAIQTGEKMP